jgi:formamidopyrimidine-DNA glycosylase
VPELPEVHALAADLDARLRGRTVARLQLVSFAALKTVDPPVSALDGARIQAVRRHGKFLDLEIGDVHLVMHLARAGWIRWRPASPLPPVRGAGPIAARLVLEPIPDGTDGNAGFDVTEFGKKKALALYVVREPWHVPGIARLGPDPLGDRFTRDVLAGILDAAGRAQLKGVLRDQSRIAGIGNAYSDEILHAARMSPFKPATLGPAEVDALFEAMQSTLREAIARVEGLAASDLKAEKKTNLRVHGRAGEPCPVCGDTVRQVRFADSSLEYCPTCQTGGKVLADRGLSRLLK